MMQYTYRTAPKYIVQVNPFQAQLRRVHSGVVNLVGIETVWVVLEDGNVTLQVEQPGF